MAIPQKCKWLPAVIFVFSASVELLQYFRIVELLGLESNVFMGILIGSVFDIKDIGCYGVGCILLWLFENFREKK